jgi:hypothetical protein
LAGYYGIIIIVVIGIVGFFIDLITKRREKNSENERLKLIEQLKEELSCIKEVCKQILERKWVHTGSLEKLISKCFAAISKKIAYELGKRVNHGQKRG